MFQSSPALSGRCNRGVSSIPYGYTEFQSSPALSGRCNQGRAARARRVYRFNPHRPFRAGATRHDLHSHIPRMRFQSSPALSGRCNATPNPTHLWSGRAFQSSPALSGRCNTPLLIPLPVDKSVSILTGPFGPVQRVRRASRADGGPEFQSSPALSGRCNLRLWVQNQLC